MTDRCHCLRRADPVGTALRVGAANAPVSVRGSARFGPVHHPSPFGP